MLSRSRRIPSAELKPAFSLGGQLCGKEPPLVGYDAVQRTGAVGTSEAVKCGVFDGAAGGRLRGNSAG